MDNKHILTIEVFVKEDNKMLLHIYRKSDDIVTWDPDLVMYLENNITIHDKDDPCIVGYRE
jgi:hypothetical protein